MQCPSRVGSKRYQQKPCTETTVCTAFQRQPFFHNDSIEEMKEMIKYNLCIFVSFFIFRVDKCLFPACRMIRCFNMNGIC
ncbi:Hypothetical protein GbCGDNIH9_8608 [Granulibacter bethesdensis]|uniref:Uncharacterized protein n=1 Tax=Granulibacter bethesdensis TaxID=364410 RepID=A0AAC9KAQ3_9PROT|nr:Hypothetical protein GbCGDNIH9_8608 [Granulibacter bethesdensis]APH62498.1 Hypothetical protein GbCGDNIH8_8608 [Granulibacter bethesdensis]